KPDEEPQVRVTEQAPFGMGEKDDSEIVLARLQANCSRVVDAFGEQRVAELLEAPARECRQGFGHIAQISKRIEPGTAIGQLADVFAGTRRVQLRREI